MSKLVSYKDWHLVQMLKEVPYSSVSLHKGGFLAILKSTVDPDPFLYVLNSYNSRALILRVHSWTPLYLDMKAKIGYRIPGPLPKL